MISILCLQHPGSITKGFCVQAKEGCSQQSLQKASYSYSSLFVCVYLWLLCKKQGKSGGLTFFLTMLLGIIQSFLFPKVLTVVLKHRTPFHPASSRLLQINHIHMYLDKHHHRQNFTEWLHPKCTHTQRPPSFRYIFSINQNSVTRK